MENQFQTLSISKVYAVNPPPPAAAAGTFLLPEIIAEIAEYCSAKDQLNIRLLCKDVKSALPKVFLLNLKYFKEKCDVYNDIEKKEGVPQFKFKLNPCMVEKDPFSVLEFISDYFLRNHVDLFCASDVYADRWKNNWPELMGDCLKNTFLKVLQQPNHSKFSLLTLPLAAFANCIPAMNFLLNPTRKSKIPKDDYQTALYSSCGRGCPEALKMLLDLQDPRANPSDDKSLPIDLAAYQGRTSCIEILLQDQRVNPADRQNLAIRYAVLGAHLESFLLLFRDERVDPSEDDNYCIRTAAWNGNLEIFTDLLNDPRVDPSAENNDAIQTASNNGHTAIVRLLLADPRVDALAMDNEALKEARQNGHLEVVALLEEHLTNRGLPLP